MGISKFAAQMGFGGESDDDRNASGVRHGSVITPYQRTERERSRSGALIQASQEVQRIGLGDAFQNPLTTLRQPESRDLSGFRAPLLSALASSLDHSQGESKVLFRNDSGVVRKRKRHQQDMEHLPKRPRLHREPGGEEPSGPAAPLTCVLVSSGSSDLIHEESDVLFVKAYNSVQERKDPNEHQDRKRLRKRPRRNPEVVSQGEDDPFQIPLQNTTQPGGEGSSDLHKSPPYILISSDQSQEGNVAQKRTGNHHGCKQLCNTLMWCQDVVRQSDDDPFQIHPENPTQSGGEQAPLPYEPISSDQFHKGKVSRKRKHDQQESKHLRKRFKWHHEVEVESDLVHFLVPPNLTQPGGEEPSGLVAPLPNQLMFSESSDQSQKWKVSYKLKSDDDSVPKVNNPMSNVLGDIKTLCSSNGISVGSSDQAQKENVQERGENHIIPDKAYGVSQKRKREEQDNGHKHEKKKQKKHNIAQEAQSQDDKQPCTTNVTSDWNLIKGLPYLKGPMLGEGGFGSVFAGARTYDGLQVAIKFVPKDAVYRHVQTEDCGSIPMEIALMNRVNSDPACPNILHLVEWFELPDQYVMILERPDPCKDLHTFCEDRFFLSEILAKKVMKQLINALKHCERRGVLHRDVKPPNILIRTDTHHVKLLDFGCGDLLKDSAYKTFAGTYKYAPPEWFVYGQYHATPATVWSVGVTLYEILCNNLPFDNTRDIVKCKLRLPGYLSRECRDLIRWCLHENPEERPTLEDMEQHAWFK